jgi:hypothetical protein
MSEELVTRIGRLRIEHELDTPEKEKRSGAREQLGVEDAAIRIAAGLTGKSDAERRAAFRAVQPGATVTAEGTSKTRRTREELLADTKAWAETLDEEARAEYLSGDKFAAKSERAQKLIEEAFDQLDGSSDQFAAGDDGDWSLEALDQDQDADDGDEDDTELEFSPVLPWEQRDINGNLYQGEDV